MRYGEALLLCESRVMRQGGACPVCDRPIGDEPRLMSTPAGREWVCAECAGVILSVLEANGRARAKRIINTPVSL